MEARVEGLGCQGVNLLPSTPGHSLGPCAFFQRAKGWVRPAGAGPAGHIEVYKEMVEEPWQPGKAL